MIACVGHFVCFDCFTWCPGIKGQGLTQLVNINLIVHVIISGIEAYFP